MVAVELCKGQAVPHVEAEARSAREKLLDQRGVIPVAFRHGGDDVVAIMRRGRELVASRVVDWLTAQRELVHTLEFRQVNGLLAHAAKRWRGPQVEDVVRDDGQVLERHAARGPPSPQ